MTMEPVCQPEQRAARQAEVNLKNPFLRTIAIPPVYTSSWAFRGYYTQRMGLYFISLLSDIQLETPTN